MFPNSNENIEPKKRRKRFILNIFLVVGFSGVFVYYFLSAPFGNKDITIHISNGMSVNTVVEKLENENAVRHDLALKIFVKLLKSGKGIVSGDYLIKKNSPVWKVAWQIGRGHHNIEPVRIIIREGLTNEDIATILAEKLSGFRKDLFLFDVNGKEGYLFPDTYFFFPNDTAEEIVDKLSANFDSKTKSLIPKIETSGKSLKDVLTMASILEGEAGGKEDAEIISGILWKRIALGMPLQVDVDKRTYEVKGLPSSPISNPGLVSINAALFPIESKYLYYLHDKDGNVHYAVTFSEHKSNIAKYLK